MLGCPFGRFVWEDEDTVKEGLLTVSANQSVRYIYADMEWCFNTSDDFAHIMEPLDYAFVHCCDDFIQFDMSVFVHAQRTLRIPLLLRSAHTAYGVHWNK